MYIRDHTSMCVRTESAPTNHHPRSSPSALLQVCSLSLQTFLRSGHRALQRRDGFPQLGFLPTAKIPSSTMEYSGCQLKGMWHHFTTSCSKGMIAYDICNDPWFWMFWFLRNDQTHITSTPHFIPTYSVVQKVVCQHSYENKYKHYDIHGPSMYHCKRGRAIPSDCWLCLS